MKTGIALVARRRIRAGVERVFDAWTQPEQLRAWWGPRPVTCSDAEVDLRVGGHYRIVNAMPDGKSLTIHGEFRVVEAPRKLVYTWQTGVVDEVGSLVTVQFEADGDSTEVIVVHEQIPSERSRESHEAGWRGCLEGLDLHFTGNARAR